MDAASAASQKKEFRTIAHSGGTVTITLSLDPNTGRKRYQLTWNYCRPNRGGIFAVYVLPPGIIVSQLNLGGIGSAIKPPPIPGRYQVFIRSDSEGKMVVNALCAMAIGGANSGSSAPTAGAGERRSNS